MKQLINYNQLGDTQSVAKILEDERIAIQPKLDLASIIVQSNDDKKQAKKDLASIRKIKKEYEDNRKSLKEELMKPYNEFNELYDDLLLNPIKEAETQLDATIKDFARAVTQENTQKAIEYFNDTSDMDWLKFDQLGITITDADASLKDAMKSIDTKLTTINNELKIIDTLPNKELVLKEYQKSLNLQEAITSIQEALDKVKGANVDDNAIAQEEPSQKDEETQELAPIESIDEVKQTYDLKVILSDSELESLINYLNENKITYSI